MYRTKFFKPVAVAALALSMTGAPAFAQEEAPAVNNGNVSVSASLDFVTEYWFRGIAQQNQGLIVQPGGDISIALWSNEDFSLDGYFGVWNSWHFNQPGVSDDNFWYEADFYIGVALGLPGGFGVDLSYVNLYGPAGGGEFAEEIDLGISYDDSDLWGDSGFALSPYALFAFEIDAGSDGLGKAGDKGVYLELGIEPAFTVLDSEDYPLTLSVPVALGFDIDDYYETSTGADDSLAFVDVGVMLSMPLSNVPAEFGAWEIYGGVHYIALSDAATDIGSADFGVIASEDDDSFYGVFGISMSY